MSYKFHETIA